MPRKTRMGLCGVASTKTYAPGALHHIIIRGIERRRIFSDGQDRDNFIECLGEIDSETKSLKLAVQIARLRKRKFISPPPYLSLALINF
jgi:hypothetical protein